MLTQKYLVGKQNYRHHVTEAKRQAQASFIESAPNKCKATWRIMRQEHSSNNEQEINL